MSVLSRNPHLQISGVRVFHWNPPACKMDLEALNESPVIVHLAGAGIAEKRWTKKRRQRILDSRVESMALLYASILESAKKPQAFISSSAIGWYGGLSGEKPMTEELGATADFMGQTCLLWEAGAEVFRNAGIRTVKIRTGVVLSTESGALPKMALPVKLGLASALGSGEQIVSWIHIADIVGIYLKAIEDEGMKGVYNGVAPAADNFKHFICALAKTLGRPCFMPAVPASLLKMIMGEMAVLVTEGSRISAQKIQDAGYVFQFRELEKALADLYSK